MNGLLLAFNIVIYSGWPLCFTECIYSGLIL